MEPLRPAPAEPPRAPQGASGGRRHESPQSGDDVPVLAPREEAQIEQAVTLVGRRGRGPVVVGAVVVAAFLLGLFRPWDLLAPAVEDPAPIGRTSAATAGPAGPTAPTEPRRAPTCGYPSQWRTATIEDWAGRRARVWKAASVVAATGPEDPAIVFEPIIAATITAIGWCAPIDGPERPPLALSASLYRIRDGVAEPLPFDRLEPAGPDAMGELWVPKARGVGNRQPWPLGRYVIELRSASGGYVRFLGLELSDHVVRTSPAASPGPSTGAAPGSAPP